MTNFERIKGMNVEELADFLLDVESQGYNGYSVADSNGYPDFEKWLEAECCM